MEALQKTFNQFRALFTSMSSSQRGTLLVIPLMIVGAFAFLMFSGRSSSYVPLSWGKTFTSEEIGNAEQALSEAGLTEFRREGMRLMVPRNEVDQYNTALLDGGSLPVDWASELEKQQESVGFFGSDKSRQMVKDISIAKALRRMIRGFPDIRNADVIFDRSKPSGWRSKGPTVTATVSVVPRRSVELSAMRVAAIRSAVANAIIGLDANGVVVVDQRNMKAYKAETANDPLNNRYLRRIDEFTERYESKIEASLDYIPNVIVTVSVDLDNLKRSVTRRQTLNAKQTVAIQTTEQKRSRELSQNPARSEPGQTNNRPRSLQTGTGVNKTQKSNESNTKTISVPSWEFNEQEMIGALPKAVQVSVGVPEEYFQKVAEQEATEASANAAEGSPPPAPNIAAIKSKIEADVKQTVLKAIGTGATLESIHFNSIRRIEAEIPELKISITETIGTVISRWGGAVGLALFAVWVLWMLNKSMPKLPEVIDLPESALVAHAPDEEEQEPVEAVENTQRDELQSIVRDNPEMAASVLGKWLQSPSKP